MADITSSSIPSLDYTTSVAGTNPAKGSLEKTNTNTSNTSSDDQYTYITDENYCYTHHGTYADGFPQLDAVTPHDLLRHQDIHSVKFAVNSLCEDFSRASDFNAPDVNISASSGDIITAYDWGKLRNTLNNYFDANISYPEGEIEADYQNSLKRAYDNYKNNCLCNSDCACNFQCLCNGDCGCNY